MLRSLIAPATQSWLPGVFPRNLSVPEPSPATRTTFALEDESPSAEDEMYEVEEQLDKANAILKKEKEAAKKEKEAAKALAKAAKAADKKKSKK